MIIFGKYLDASFVAIYETTPTSMGQHQKQDNPHRPIKTFISETADYPNIILLYFKLCPIPTVFNPP